ncbi:MAG TPA: hypothetical protein VEL76_04570 [Gemmataceae bacterium]|nr:hypothetical protein [Gemmataceae bacterium]
MSSPQQPAAAGQQGAVIVPTMPQPIYAFGWPPGSIRAMLTLIIVAIACALILISKHNNQPIPVPAYLVYLLFLAVAFYFGARGQTHHDTNVPPPLYLPRGCVRLIILAALTATVTYKIVNDRTGLEDQFRASFDAAKTQPLLPLVVFGGFFVGVIVRAIIGRHERSAWAQNMEAWFALIAVLMMSIAALIDLVIKPTLPQWVDLPTWEGILGGVVSFYFGVRS